VAIELGLVDELRMFRYHVVVGADDVPDGINAADHAAGLSSSLDSLAAYHRPCCGALHTQVVGVPASRAALPLMASASAIAW
jgi:hypothetical protein